MADTAQPLDALMTKLGLSNADLVEASTEQLSFKMVHKGRTGRRITPNVQDKIVTALLAARPGLQVKRRDLFRYPANEAMIGGIELALGEISSGKIDYPHFVDLLQVAGVVSYVVDVASNRITFYGFEGDAYEVQGPALGLAPDEKPGRYDEERLKNMIAGAEARKIDHLEFLRRIYSIGITSYESNLRKRRVDYKGESASFRQLVPEYDPAREAATLKPPKKGAKEAPKAEPAPPAKTKDEKPKKKRPGIVRTTRKKRLTLNKLYFRKKSRARRPKKKHVKVAK